MSDINKFSALVDDIWELVFGTKRKSKKQEDIGHYIGLKPKRARGKKGKYLADDPTTAFTNEAWVGGKSPMSKKERNALDRAMRKAAKLREKK